MVAFIPIFLGGLLGKIVRVAGTVLTNVGGVVPLPGAGILRAAGNILAPPRTLTPATVGPIARIDQRFRPRMPGTQASRFPGNALEQFAGSQRFAQQFHSQNGCAACGTDACSCGCVNGKRAHVNKSGYYVQAQPGVPEAGGVWVAAGSKCVSNRSRNNFNGRANARAVSRITSWAKTTKRLRKSVKALEVSLR